MLDQDLKETNSEPLPQIASFRGAAGLRPSHRPERGRQVRTSVRSACPELAQGGGTHARWKVGVRARQMVLEERSQASGAVGSAGPTLM